MLQKFKITSWAFILVLFGFSLMTVSPVLAHNAEAEDLGDHTHEHEEAAVDDAEGTKEALKLQIEEISGWLKDKDARIAHLHERESVALLELQEKDETIAYLNEHLSIAQFQSQEKDETIVDLTDRFAHHAQAQAEFDATIAELQNQLSTAHSESEAQVELIADLQRQLAIAIERADELLTGQDEVGRTQSSPGLWYDEAREHCSTSDKCSEYLTSIKQPGKYDEHNYKKDFESGCMMAFRWGQRDPALNCETFGKMTYMAKVMRQALPPAIHFDGWRGEWERAAALLTFLGNAEWEE